MVRIKNSNYEPYELNEVLRSQHDIGGSEEGSEDMTSWCRSIPYFIRFCSLLSKNIPFTFKILDSSYILLTLLYKNHKFKQK